MPTEADNLVAAISKLDWAAIHREAGLQGLDMYRALVSRALGISPEQVTREQRNIAKTAFFSFMYGVWNSPLDLAKLAHFGSYDKVSRPLPPEPSLTLWERLLEESLPGESV